ncbi:hypothetical protein FP74_gp050 [Bacillus phage CAM003]|uniref:Thymidylate synthase n=3 Tax=Bastillevirus TaxID=1918010 RepID=A0A024B0T6_9CAUD|nr:thymidylate synthase [Bacillus phage Evoli]YP_009036953.1 hypothetical protein FP74_gp050 [Bacillus phage CAM003]AHZ09487.1 hypothetical protein [Bacillus phage CAM003]AHZ09776.1 thymidylate synthase [Bacillus phage Evoli]AMW61805.1 hypothetical protein DNAM5_54 [Bacillus phage Vinny]
MITHEMLDKRICDVEEVADNPQTYREFIRESEEEFCMASAPLEDMTVDALTDYFEFIDYLWEK